MSISKSSMNPYLEGVLQGSLIGGVLHQGIFFRSIPLALGASTFVGFQVALLTKIVAWTRDYFASFAIVQKQMPAFFYSERFVNKIVLEAIEGSVTATAVAYFNGISASALTPVVLGAFLFIELAKVGVKEARKFQEAKKIPISFSHTLDIVERNLNPKIEATDRRLDGWKDFKGNPLKVTSEDAWIQISFASENGKKEFFEIPSSLVPRKTTGALIANPKTAANLRKIFFALGHHYFAQGKLSLSQEMWKEVLNHPLYAKQILEKIRSEILKHSWIGYAFKEELAVIQSHHASLKGEIEATLTLLAEHQKNLTEEEVKIIENKELLFRYLKVVAKYEEKDHKVISKKIENSPKIITEIFHKIIIKALIASPADFEIFEIENTKYQVILDNKQKIQIFQEGQGKALQGGAGGKVFENFNFASAKTKVVKVGKQTIIKNEYEIVSYLNEDKPDHIVSLQEKPDCFLLSKKESIIIENKCLEDANDSILSGLIHQLDQKDKVKVILKGALQLFEALNYLKQKKVHHGDIKSANIFLVLTKAKQIIFKLWDFGGSGKGKPATILAPSYAPREDQDKILNNEVGMPFCYQHDMFAMGVTIFEIMTGGELPYPVKKFFTMEYPDLTNWNYERDFLPKLVQCGYSDQVGFILKKMFMINPTERISSEDLIVEWKQMMDEEGDGYGSSKI